MFVLPGYIIHETIHESAKVTVDRGVRAQDQMPVIIKALKREAASPLEISRFLYEYEITKGLDIEGIIKPIKLENIQGVLALVMEDTGAIPLREYVSSNHISISTFFNIAIQLTETIGELHQNGLIHRNLKLENILVHPDTCKVKVIDFSSAVPFFMKSGNDEILSMQSENREHMIPEKSGQSGYAADYRSDYYSLGTVFFEILTGQPPLHAGSLAERQNAYTARMPESPDKINPEVPGVLSAIIMKLLSRNADEGYQNACGLLKDLEECKKQWDRTGKIEPFPPGRMDISPHFELPRKLYGRDNEIKALQKAFECACAGQGGLVLVSGYAGVGKTVLINKTLKSVALEKGYFGYGKFDQLRQNIPYAPFARALGNVMRQLLTESKDRLDVWKKKILSAVGRNGAIITELIPEAEMVIGRQQPVEALQPKEAQNRFLMTFGNFIRVFAEEEHPLAIFLDDLQWADLSSLQLLKYLCADTRQNYLLLVGAYRDNEIYPDHPLTLFIEEVRNEGICPKQIYLAPLDRTEVTEFIEGTLHCSGEKADVLAEILYRKTYGIPFFMAQMLKSVYDEKLITFNMRKGCWEYDIESIQEFQMPDDVIGLILAKLKILPEETLFILKIASCIGNRFDLKTLSTACGKTQTEAIQLLLPAAMEGLVLPALHSNGELSAGEIGMVAYVNDFLHDVVRQAVYSLLSDEEKKKTHIAVGRVILKNIEENKLDEKILPTLDHLNRGLDLIDDPFERLKLAEYNLAAGRKIKASAAYDLALNYFRSAMILLPADSWDSCYRLCYDIHLECAQCAYLTGDVQAAEHMFEILTDKAKTELERADIYGLKMVLYAGTGKYDEAVRIGINVLGNLGMKLPLNPGMLDNARELLLYKWYMRNKSIQDLAELPEMKNPVQRKIAQLLINLIFVTCTSHSDLYAFSIIKAGNHVLRYGKIEMASIGYIGYSITEGSVLGNYSTGYELGKLAIAHVEKFGKSYSKCVVYFTVGALISHWTRHGEEGLQYLYKALQYAIEAGNVLMIGYSYGVILENRYLMGTALGEVLKEAQKYSSYARRMKHENLAVNAAVYERLASALTGRISVFDSIDADGFDEDYFVKLAKGDKSSLAAYYFLKIQLCYLFGHYRDALANVEKIKSCAGAIMGFMLSAEYNFYHSLVIAAVYDELPSKERKRFLRILKKNQRQMKKWAGFCRDNYQHKYLLVEAEMSRISGRKQEAGIFYDEAIKSAHESGYIQNEAIAYELASRFYAAEGREMIAKAYMKYAFNLYCQWGAAAKAKDLELKYPGLLDGISVENENVKYNSLEILKNVIRFSGADRNKTSITLDIGTIQRAIREISEQPETDKLPESFLEIAIESTGADKGYLILEKHDELFIEVAKDGQNSPVVFAEPVAVEKSNKLSKHVVRYVARTLESVIVDNDGHVGIFAKDPYIAKSEVKSIACIPLHISGIPIGVLYLENSFTTGVFTKEVLELVKLLSCQATYARALKTLLERDKCETKNGKCLLPVESLTERETEVLRLIAAGFSNKEIAENLDMTINTVKTHIKNIYGKLQVNRRVQVAARMKELEIL